MIKDDKVSGIDGRKEKKEMRIWENKIKKSLKRV